MKQDKTKYLSYIEETPKHYNELRDLAKIAASKAITNAKAHNLPVTFMKDGWIIREDAKGNQTKVSKLKNYLGKPGLVSNHNYLKGRRLRVFAGPNGSGKTTIFKQIAENFDIGYYVNADELEVQLITTKKVELGAFNLVDLQEDEFDHFQKDHSILQKALQSGFKMNLSYSSSDNSIVDLASNISHYSYEAALIADFLRIKLIERGKKLTFETVMSHPSKLDILQYASNNGYKVYLYFVCTQSADINVARVLQRVGQGGHDVLEEKIRKRYKSSLQLLRPAVKNTFRSFIWDNSQLSPELILEVEDGQIVTQISETLPSWVEEFLLQ